MKFPRFLKKPHSEAPNPFTYGIACTEAAKNTEELRAQELQGIDRYFVISEELESTLDWLIKWAEKNNYSNYFNHFIAIKIRLCTLIRTSFVDPIDADIAMLDAEHAIGKFKLSLKNHDYKLGLGSILDAFNLVEQSAWCDAKNGRKLKIMKFTGKRIEITQPETQQKVEGLLP